MNGMDEGFAENDKATVNSFFRQWHRIHPRFIDCSEQTSGSALRHLDLASEAAFLCTPRVYD